MDPVTFVADLQRVSAEVSGGAAGQVPVVTLPSAWIVEAGDQRIDVPAQSFRRALENARRNPSTWPAQRSRILAQLGAMLDEARAFAAQSSVRAGSSPADSRGTLNTILSGAEFRQLREQSAFTRLRQRAAEWLLDVWDRLGGSMLGRRGTAIVFAWIAVLVTLGMLASWLMRVILRSPQSEPFGLTPAPSKRRSARAWARDAMTAADPREAMRYAYRALICGLEEEGAWRLDDARTPREYLRLLPADHRRRGPAGDVIRRFEEVWFAARAATEADRAAVVARLKELGCLPAD
ncbi:MAG TPA: DUF4129 domain-containing protein [Vicinamibacterales bacterium]|nr:DUF4129 domain-containing protein [Vicinamibacterales bacterium]